MPIEQADNTRVVQPPIIEPLPEEEVKRLQQIQLQKMMQREPDQLWDADKVNRYKNMQNFYNNNFFGYGVGGRQTNFDPRTPQGQAAIQSNFNYARNNAKTFGELIATAAVGEGATQAIKYATTPVKIGQGAEAVVYSSPISTTVTKASVIPRAEMHIRNTVPGAVRARFVGMKDGLNTYVQSKVRIVPDGKLDKSLKALESLMTKKGWKKITHPNLDGPGYTNGQWVVSDLGSGNIGRDWLGRIRLPDFTLESVPAFKLAMQRRGGKIVNNN